MSALGIDGLHVELGGRLVLEGITLSVGAGEFVGLLGPNGAGKTTLLRSTLGLVRPRSGRVLIDGHHPRAQRSSVGYVPQRHQFDWEFPISVEQVVMSGQAGRLGVWRRPQRDHWEAVDNAIDRVGLDHLRSRPVGQLSGGQRQRVLVARALAIAPALLLLDEPFTGLDLPTQDQLAELFVDLAADGHAVVMSTHDLLSAHHGCSRLVLLNRRVVADGSPSDLQHPEPWMTTFGITDTSPLLRLVGAA